MPEPDVVDSPHEVTVEHGTTDQVWPPGGLRSVVEAVVMASDAPLSAARIAGVLGTGEAQVTAALGELALGYAEGRRGIVLHRVSGGWQIATRPDLHDYVVGLVKQDVSSKLSQAALETLSVVAYRQPVTRSRMSAIRGVNVDGVVRTLIAHGLITEVEVAEESHARHYGTTPYFLQRMGLNSLDDLPPIAAYLPDDAELDDLAGEVT